jgi:hypothetical protein
MSQNQVNMVSGEAIINGKHGKVVRVDPRGCWIQIGQVISYYRYNEYVEV